MPDDAAECDDDRVDATSTDATPTGATRRLSPQLPQELVALRERVDALGQDVAALGARLHTLDEAITGVETALGDRLSDYADTVVQLGRGLTSNLSTYREGNERTVSDLRRALADSEELLRAVLTKSDDLAVELAAVRREFQRLRRADARTSKNDAAVAREQTLVDELHAMRDEITQLKRRIAIRAKAPTIDDGQLAAIANRISATVELRVSEAELQRLAEAVAQRLSEAFELVPDDG